MRKAMGCDSPISSTEAERAASGVHRFKIISDEREGDLNLIHLQRVTHVDENEVVKTLIQVHPKRLFTAIN